jgi:Protein of unknown function (DUF3631)
MPRKGTPAQTFKGIFDTWAHPGTEPELRAIAERKMDAWLRRYGKTRADISAILAQAAADEAASRPPPPPSDPRDGASHPFDDPSFTPLGLVHGITGRYLTMAPHVHIIYSGWTCFTHVYEQFEIAPRLSLTSKKPFTGKSTARKVASHLVYRPNEEAFGTVAALRDFLGEGAGTLLLDELDYNDAHTQRQLRRIWNHGYERGAKTSLKVEGKRKLVGIYAPILGAGIGTDFFEPTQESRTYQLEMERYTQETRPERRYDSHNVGDLNVIYSYLRNWARTVKLDPDLDTAGLILRDEDNARGLLAVADSCGPEWRRQMREALQIYAAQERAKQPRVLIIEHGLMIFDAYGLEQLSDVLSTTEFNRQLKHIDLRDAPWSRYRGAGGRQYPHPITVQEQADLLREEPGEFESHPHWPPGPRTPGASFKAYYRGDFEAAWQRYTQQTWRPGPRLRLVAPENN